MRRLLVPLGLLLTTCGGKTPIIVAPVPLALEGGTVTDPLPKSAVWIGNCTAAKVGPRVIQTAAHCTSNGSSREFKTDGQTFRATFTIHQEYSEASAAKYVAAVSAVRLAGKEKELAAAAERGTVALAGTLGLSQEELAQATADWSLGFVDKEMPGPYTPLLLTAGKMTVGMKVTLSGYGCQSWGGGLDGKYRIGESTVSNLPSGSNYDVVTKGGSAVCSGDSGGPAFVTVDGKEYVFAPNSRRQLSALLSMLPGWFAATASNWAKAWAEEKKTTLCGVGPADPRCRGDGPGPTPTPTPSPTGSPTPPGPSPSPSPSPVPPLPSINSCKGALISLEAKLFYKPFGDGKAELALLNACAAAPRPLPEMAMAP